MDMCVCFTFILTVLGFTAISLAKNITVYSGKQGEALTIVCPYHYPSNRWAKKLWCKEDEVGLCQAVVSAHRYPLNRSKTSGSTTIADNAYKGMVTVNITNLQIDDAGVYQCRTVIFGDIAILQKIKVLVFEDNLQGNVSAQDKVQYSLSGSQSESQLYWMMFVLGSSLLLCKVLIMGLLYSWWKIQQAKKVNHESFPFLPVELHVHPGERSEETFNAIYSEGDSGPHYMNYIYRGHLVQTFRNDHPVHA